MTRTADAAFSSIVTFTLLLTTTGCMSEPLEPRPTPAPAQAAINRPPKDVIEQLKRVIGAEPLNLGVTEELDGVIVTGWQRHRGNFHVGRHWQERTRYRIAVIPDWNEPTQRARIEVAAQTEERAAEGQTWTPAPQVHRPERAQAVLDQIVSALGASSAAPPTAR
jgi:hypothetical protein